MFKSAKRKKSQGFTLAEVLIVVAIIGILLAVAIPNVISYYCSLKLTELDDSARTIFMAAQNRLTAMKSAGANLYALSTVEVNEKPDPGVGTGRFLAVTSAQADSLASIVPGGSIEPQLHDNHYVVEIDAKTGAVYAVWYWEKEDFDYQSESYGAVKPAKSDRLEAGRMVGYYGGSFIDRPTIGQTPMPSARVINAEELALNITVSGDGFTGTPPSIKATITLINGSVECVIVSDASLKYDPFENVFTGRVALDTLDDSKYTLANNANSFESDGMGKPFKDWVYDTMTLSRLIAPGANFDIEVKITAVDAPGSTDPVSYLPQYIYWTGINSLFESVDGGTAKIAYGRHLQNLDKDTSDVTPTITAAEQTRNIDFDDNGSGIQSWDDTYKDDTTGDDGHIHQTFHAINNNNLANFNGANKTIKNLNVVETGVAGLFGSFGAAPGGTNTISNVTLINAKVSGDGNTGTLIGETTTNHVTVSGCKVYLENYTVPATIVPYINSNGSVAGGLIGSAGSDVTISKSSASTVVSGGTSTGGLVGSVNSGITLSIGQSYAASYLSGGSSIGGLVAGDQGSVTVDNSYAAGIIAVTGSGSVAGIMPRNSGRVENSYAAVRYVKDAAAAATIYGVAQNGTTMTDNAFYVKQAGITYALDSGTGESMSTLKGKIGAVPFDGPDWYVPDAGATVNPHGLTVPYNILEEGLADPYPYPMLASDITTVGGASLPMPHYGDWLEGTATASSLCYYEKYVGGTEYNLWGYISPDPAAAATLVKGLDGTSGTLVAEDGYCIPIKVGDSAPDGVTVDGKSYTVEPIKNVSGATITVEHGGTTYELYKITGLDDYIADVNGDGSDETSYYYEIDLGGAKYWFNPFFACEIVQETTTPKPTAPQAKDGAAGTGSALTGDFDGKVVIRTARQLANLAAATGSKYDDGIDAQKRSYVQLLNIDFAVYSQNVKGKDLTTWEPAALITGSYDGNTFVISNLYINKTGENIGMFGNTKGTLKNIRLKNTKVSGGERVGALVGRLEGGKIENCGVYVGKGSYNDCFVRGASRVGGLAGHVNSQNNAELKGCFAAVKVVGTSGNDGVGGLIGCYSAKDDTGIIEDCYSGGHTEGGIYTSANVSCAGKNVGGLIGKITDNAKVTLKGTVYSTCSVSGNDSDTIGLLIGGFDTGKNPTIDSSAATVYATGKAFDSAGTEVTPRDEDAYNLITDLTNPAIRASTSKTTTPHPYDDHWETATKYPYLSNLGEHHGDWRDIPVASSLCYYEAYEGGSYGLWGYLSPTEHFAYQLKDGDLYDLDLDYAVEDGYGVLVKDGEAVPTFSDPALTIDGTTPLKEDAYTDLSGTSYDLYKITVGSTFTPANYYTKITVGGAKYWFNPDFACEILTADPAANINTPQEKLGTDSLSPTATTGNYNGKVIIRTARQLVNLAAATGSTIDPGNAAQGRSYVQLLDIDYGEYTDVTMGTDSIPQSPAALSDVGSYDGNHFVIKNLYIDGGASSAGLFGEAAGTMSNIRLVNVSVSGGSNVGALAGQFSGIEVTDCGVYLDAAGDIEDAYNTFTVTGAGENVGGLIGLMDGDSLTGCFAAVKVEGGDNVGGLVGQISAVSATLTDGYSGGHTEGGVYVAGEYSAKVNVSGGENVGGLIGLFNDDGSGNTLTLSGVNYSTCSVTGENPDTLGLLIGYAGSDPDTTVDTNDATLYATGTAFDSTGPLESGNFREESYLSDLDDVEGATVTDTHPYDTALFDSDGKALPYPYTSNLTEHYGDWMAAEKVEACGIAYFEEEGGEIKLQIRGYFGIDAATDEITDADGNLINTLCTEKDWASISNSGYVTFKTGNVDNGDIAPELNGLGDPSTGESSGEGEEEPSGATVESAIQKVLRDLADKKDIDAPLDTLILNTYNTPETGSVDNSEDYCVEIPSDGGGSMTVYYTNGFAGLSDTAYGGAGNPFLIRTAQQLNNIPDGDGDGSTTSPTSGMNFRQTHDITGEDGYSGAIEFAGTFDGRGYRIQSLKSAEEAADCTGLFESLTDGATISNVVLYSDNGDYELNVEDEGLAIGGIANKASGTVSLTNCAVMGYHHEFNISKNDVTSFNYGELIGEVESGGTVTITNCAAINNAELNIDYTRTTPLIYYYGGLVGKIAGELTLTNCYTGGIGTMYDNGGGTGGGSTGVNPNTGVYGLTGKIDGSVTAKNCYSWMINGFTSQSPVAQLSPDDFTVSEDNYYIYNDTVDNRRGELRKYTEFWADNWETDLDKTHDDGNFGKAASNHPFTTTDKDILYDDFPFPEVIREVNKDGTPGGFIHYGDWPSQATSGPEFGFYFVYSSDSQLYAGGNLDSYAVGLMYDKNGESSYDFSRIGVTSEDGPQKGKPEHIPYWGFAIRKANKSKMDDIWAKLSVELYDATGTMLSKLDSANIELKPTGNNKEFTNESEYAGYDLYISTGKLPDTVQSALKAPGSTVVVVVKYGNTEIARFNWSTVDPETLTKPTTGDPGIPEGPSFEGAMAPAGTEAIVPEKLKPVEE